MSEAPARVSTTPEITDPLARADALEGEITALCADINAASYRLLCLIAELDDEAPWGAWGLRTCAHWLNWRCGIGLNAAREKVRVAHALKQLPEISAAFAKGELSFSKVRAITRVANADNEAELLRLARHGSAAQVEKLARGYRQAERREENDRAMTQMSARELTCYVDDDGSLVIHARLPAEEGAVVLQALDAAMDAQSADRQAADAENVTAVTSMAENRFAQRRADALIMLAETTLRHGPESLPAAERYQVMIHVDAETLADDADGRCHLDNGDRLPVDTLRRLACDASLLQIIEDQNGKALDIGRKTRAVPPAMRRALHSRDGGCRFPGCTQHRHVDAHHIRHWARGGETRLDNLVLLCRYHHRLVHEGGFEVERTADESLRFVRPDGRYLEQNPQLEATGSIDGLRCANRLAGEVTDARNWIIPDATLDCGIAVERLMWIREKGSSDGVPAG